MKDKSQVDADAYFAIVPEWILFDKTIKPSDKVVWAVLQRYANDKNLCWPGHETIAENAGISRRQVQYSINRLVAAGMITVRQRKRWVEKDGKKLYVNGTNVYCLRFLPPSARKAEAAGGGDDGDHAVVEQGAEIADVLTAEIAQSPPEHPAEIAQEPEPPDISISKYSLVVTAEPVDGGDPAALRAARAKPPAKIGSSQEPARPDVSQLCELLVSYMLRNGLYKQQIKVTDAWHTQARLLLDKDGVPLHEAVETLEWSQNDKFWKANILSMPKFREKYPQLRVRLLSERKPHAQPSRGDYWRDVAARMQEADREQRPVYELEEGSDGPF